MKRHFLVFMAADFLQGREQKMLEGESGWWLPLY